MSLLANHGIISASAVPAFVSGKGGFLVSETNVVVTYNATPTEGNLMVVTLGGPQSRSVSSVPSGWTEVIMAPAGGTNLIYYKFATASEPANYTFVLTGAMDGGWRFNEFSNIATSSPVVLNVGNNAAGVLTISPVSTYDVTIPSVAICTLNMDSSGTWTVDNSFTGELVSGQFKSSRFIHAAPATTQDVNWSTTSGVPRTCWTRLVLFKGKLI